VSLFQKQTKIQEILGDTPIWGFNADTIIFLDFSLLSSDF